MSHLRKTLNLLHEMIMHCEHDPELRAVTVDSDFDFDEHTIVFDDAMALLDKSELARIVAWTTCSGHNIIGELREDWENEVYQNLGKKPVQKLSVGMAEELRRSDRAKGSAIRRALVRNRDSRSS